MSKQDSKNWLFVISSKTKLLDFNFKEIWSYKDLLFLFVKRDVITLYKQTILGPLWYIIQPLFTMVIFTVFFNKVAGISTDNIPSYLFNLCGIISWNYFKDTLVGTSDTFKKNEQIFGKVYFPRVIMPLSIVFSNLLKYGIQLIIFFGFYAYYVFVQDKNITPSKALVFLPVLILSMGMLGLGLGMIISSMVTKYRDLTFLVTFGVSLLMYMSAVFYPMSLIETTLPNYSWIVYSNPMAHVIEMSRAMFLNTGTISTNSILFVGVFSISIFCLGLVIFNRTEKSFIDTV